MRASRRQGFDCTFEAVKRHAPMAQSDDHRLVIVVSAGVTFRHKPPHRSNMPVGAEGSNRGPGLGVVAAGLANAGQGYTGRLLMVARRQITQGNDADEKLLVVEYGQPPDLLVGHIVGEVVDVIFLEAVLDL